MARSGSSPLSDLAISVLVFSLRLILIAAHGGSDSDAGSGGGSGDLHSGGLIAVKIWCLAILLVSTFAAGVSPCFWTWNEGFLLLGTRFAGGVFLGTSFMHFLSDSDSTFRRLTEKEYPFAFMLASAGYLLVMLGDCFVTRAARRSGTGDAKTTSFGDALLLILALCFHSVFEGIAIGVSDSKADAWRNLWTIALHKGFAAVAMGIALLRMMPRRAFFAAAGYSFVFAVSSPVGVGIGIAIDATAQGSTADWIYAISMGVASGVFVYVAVHHLIGKGVAVQCNDGRFVNPFFEFLAVLVGVGVMAVVMIWD